MAKPAKTRPATQQKAYQLVPVIGPSAGVDLRTSPTLMAHDRARMLINFSLEEPGALVVRPGYVQFSTTSLGASRIQGAARIYLNTAIPVAASTIFTLVAWQGGIYNQNDTGGWVSTVASLSGLSTVNEIHFASDRDLVGVFDGSTSPWKSTNGSSWTHLGIASGPKSTVTVLSSGSLSSAEFEVNYTYKDRDLSVESNGSTSPSTISLGSTGAIDVQVPNSTDPQVDAIVLYARNKTSGETVRRKVSSAAMQGGAHSTYVISSSNWITNDEEPSDHDRPPVLSFGVVWKNRWWARDASRTNRIHFTQLFQPQSWPALFYVDIPFERGDAINALVPLGDTILIFGTTRIFVIIGQTSLDFEVRPTIASQDGAFGPRSVAAIENGVVHVGASGVYIFDGTSDRLLSFDLDPGWRDLVTNATAADLARLPVLYHQQRKELRVAVSRLFPTGLNGEWVMDLNRTRQDGNPAWSATDRRIGGYLLWDGPETTLGNRGRLFAWDSSNALLFEEAVGTSANSSNLTAQYESAGLSLGAFRGRWVDLRGEYKPSVGVLTLETVTDGKSNGSQSVSIGGGLSVYGDFKHQANAVYGTARYGGPDRLQFYQMLPLQAEGRTFVLKATYVGQEQLKIYSYHPGLVPETASRSFTE